MPVSPTAVIAVVLAAIVAAGLSAVVGRRQRLAEVAPWWAALTVGLAYIVGHAGVATPSFPLGDVHDRIPILALAAAIVATLLNGKRDVAWARVVGFVGLGSLTYVLILGPILGAGEFARETIIQLATTAAATLFAMTNLALLDAPSRRSELWVALTVLAAGTGVVLVLANSAVLFFLAGTLATVLVASFAGAWGRPLGGGVPVALAVLTALIVEGSVYAFLPGVAALLLAAAPALLWLNRLGPIGRLGPQVRATIASVLMLIPVGVAIALVVGSQSSDGY